jgi:hypothetical protein
MITVEMMVLFKSGSCWFTSSKLLEVNGRFKSLLQGASFKAFFWRFHCSITSENLDLTFGYESTFYDPPDNRAQS